MSTKTKKATEGVEENAEVVAVQEEAAQVPPTEEDAAAEKERQQKEKMEAFLKRLPNPCVYCGPSVRNVARQYTVYNGGIPGVLKEFIMQHPSARGLLVSTERFADVRKRLETPGTGEFILFNKVRAEL